MSVLKGVSLTLLGSRHIECRDSLLESIWPQLSSVFFLPRRLHNLLSSTLNFPHSWLLLSSPPSPRVVVDLYIYTIQCSLMLAEFLFSPMKKSLLRQMLTCSLFKVLILNCGINYFWILVAGEHICKIKVCRIILKNRYFAKTVIFLKLAAHALIPLHFCKYAHVLKGFKYHIGVCLQFFVYKMSIIIFALICRE